MNCGGGNAKKKLLGGMSLNEYFEFLSSEMPRSVSEGAWASYFCRRDNPDEYAEIIAREFRHGLRVGVNKGTTGMPGGLFSICQNT